MKTNPTVTILIPYKNNLNYIFDALESVFRQTYRNIKIIIIYDDEDKNDYYVIKKYFKSKKKKTFKLKIILNKKNLGAGHSRNIGIKNCNTKYIAFLDADDLWAKNKLKIQIDFMEKNKQVFSHSSYSIINSNKKIISKRRAKAIISFEELIKSCDIGLSTVVLNLKFIKKNKLYFPKIKTKEDFVLWLRIIKKINFIRGIDKNLTYYRKTKNSLSANKLTSLINGYKVYRDYMHYNRIKSMYYLIVLSLNFLKKKLKLEYRVC